MTRPSPAPDLNFSAVRTRRAAPSVFVGRSDR